MGEKAQSNMRLIALALVAAVAVYATPHDDFVPEAIVVHNDQLEEVVQPGEDFSLAEVTDMMDISKNMSQEQLEAEFEQMIQGEDDDTKLAVAYSLQHVAKMHPDELAGQIQEYLDQKGVKLENSDLASTDLAQAGWGGRRRRRFFKAVAKVARKTVKAVGGAVKAVGKFVVDAVKKLAHWLKVLASKLCRKVLKAIVKKVHKYIRKKVTKFCAKICIKCAAKVYIMGAGSPAAGAVAAAIGGGCAAGCKLAFDALIRYIRYRHMNNARMDTFVADFVCDAVGLNAAGGSSSSRRRSSRRRRSRRRRSRRRRRGWGLE